MDTLAERLKWLRKERGISSKEKAAQAMDIPYGTYQGWEYGLNPGKKNYNKLAAFYKCNKGWLITGEGDPFPAAPATHPAGSSQEPVRYTQKPLHGSEVHYPEPIYNKDNVKAGDTELTTQGFNISEDLILAAKVLESKTHYAIALHLNIRSFAGAVNDVATINQIKDTLERIQNLESKVSNLQDENRTLRAELNRMKATYEHPDEGDGNLTNSSAG